MQTVADRIELASGITLSYAESGSRDGTPVVFLHGITDSWRSFGPVMSRLPDTIRAVSVTLRGHGESSKPETGYTFPDFAGDIAAFMDEMEISRAVVAGHSLGSVVAQHLAARYPDRVSRLVLLGAIPPEPNKPLMRVFYDELFSVVSDPIDHSLAQEFQESTLARPIDPQQLGGFVSETQRCPARIWNAAGQSLLTMDLLDDLRLVTAPVLLIWGDQDTIALSSDQEALQAAFPHCRMSVHAGGGHALNWEDPERVAADIAAFVTGVDH